MKFIEKEFTCSIVDEFLVPFQELSNALKEELGKTVLNSINYLELTKLLFGFLEELIDPIVQINVKYFIE